MTTSEIQNQKDGNIFLINFILFFFFLLNFLILPIIKYESLNSSVYDLGSYLNSLYNISHNKLYSVAFTGHFEPILIPLSIFYKIFNYQEFGVFFILILQTISLTFLPIFFFIKKNYKLSIILISFFPLSYINLFDFHTDAFAIPIFTLFLITKDKNKFISILLLTLLCLIKEYYIYISLLCLLYLFENKIINIKLAIFSSTILILLFFIQVGILLYNSTEIPVIGNLSNTQNYSYNLKEKFINFTILFFLCIFPVLYLSSKKNLKYIILIIIPYFLYNNENVFKFNYQYFIPIYLILILCIQENLYKLEQFNFKYIFFIIIINLLLGVNILSPVFLIKNDTIYYKNYYKKDYNVGEVKNYLDNFNFENYDIISTNNYFNYHRLSNNLILHTYPNGILFKSKVSKEKKKLIKKDQTFSEIFFLYLQKDREKFFSNMSHNDIINYLEDKNFYLINNIEGFYVFKRL